MNCVGCAKPLPSASIVAALMWGYIFGSQFGLAGQVFGALGIPTPDFLGPNLMLASVGTGRLPSPRPRRRHPLALTASTRYRTKALDASGSERPAMVSIAMCRSFISRSFKGMATSVLLCSNVRIDSAP